MSVATRGEYKGHPTITLSDKPGDKYGFSFGLSKARLILAQLEDIKAFVAEDDAKAAASIQAKIDADNAKKTAA